MYTASLCKIFSTDAGQLSDRLQSFAGQISICRTEGIYVVRILFSLLRFIGHLTDRLKVFAGQNEKMPVLSGSPALFAKTVLPHAYKDILEMCAVEQ